MADRYGSTRWYNYLVPDGDHIGEHWLINAVDLNEQIPVKKKPRSGHIVGIYPGYEIAKKRISAHQEEIDNVMRPSSSYSSANYERTDPREGAPTPTTGPPRGPGGSPAAAASAPPPQSAPPQASGPQPARTSAPPPFPGAPPPYQFPPPPSYSMPQQQAPAAAAAAGPDPTIAQNLARTEAFINNLQNATTLQEVLSLTAGFHPYVEQIRAQILTGNLDLSHLKPTARKIALKFHPDKGGDTKAFQAISPILGNERGLRLYGSGKSKRRKYIM